MNKKTLDEVATLQGRVNDLLGEVEAIRDVEQEKYDNLPESLQGGDMGERMQTAIDALDSALTALSDAESSLGEVE